MNEDAGGGSGGACSALLSVSLLQTAASSMVAARPMTPSLAAALRRHRASSRFDRLYWSRPFCLEKTPSGVLL